MEIKNWQVIIERLMGSKTSKFKYFLKLWIKAVEGNEILYDGYLNTTHL